MTRPTPDPLRPARGILNGCILGGLLWVGLGVTAWALLGLDVLP